MDNVKGVCGVCLREEDVFMDETVTNAWQKNGKNYYEFKCKVCGTMNVLEFNVQDDDQTGEV